MLSGELEIEAKEALDGGLKLKGDAFAGASISGDGAMELQWREPGDGKAFGALASGGYSIKGSAGAGVEGELTIDWDEKKGRFVFRAKAVAVLGLGGGGTPAFTLEAAQLARFLRCVGYNLWQIDFHFLKCVARDAFERVSALWAYAVAFGEDLTEALLEKLDSVVAWWADESKRQVEAEALALRVQLNWRLYLDAAPETKGRLLDILTRRFLLSFEERQEAAILVLFDKTIRTRREFDKVCECITRNGTRCPREDGLAKINALLDGGSQVKFDRWLARLPPSPAGETPAFPDIKLIRPA